MPFETDVLFAFTHHFYTKTETDIQMECEFFFVLFCFFFYNFVLVECMTSDYLILNVYIVNVTRVPTKNLVALQCNLFTFSPYVCV